MPDIHYESPDRAYTLVRPGATKKQALRAWDAADEYLIETVHKNEDSKVIIINDQFGSLGTCLHRQAAYWVSDSYCAKQALTENLTNNQIEPTFNHFNPIESWPKLSNVKQAIIRLPKNLSYLSHLLKRCQDNGICSIYIAGMMKHLPKNILQYLQKYGEVQRLPFKKKATIYQLELSNPIDTSYPRLNSFNDINLSTHANVFGRDKLDPGASCFLENIKKLPSSTSVADLCAGSGILGIAYCKEHPNSHMHFFDESYMAIQSCKESSDLNKLDNLQFSWNDGLKNCNTSFDLIICNPPFHEEHTVGDHIAQRLFSDAKQHLNESGQLFVIANRHLGYHISLKKHFKFVGTVTSNSKFILLKAND